jgi:hypothetical protein
MLCFGKEKEYVFLGKVPYYPSIIMYYCFIIFLCLVLPSGTFSLSMSIIPKTNCLAQEFAVCFSVYECTNVSVHLLLSLCRINCNIAWYICFYYHGKSTQFCALLLR